MPSKAFSTAQTTDAGGGITVNAVTPTAAFKLPDHRASSTSQVMTPLDLVGGVAWQDVNQIVSSPFPAGGAMGLVLTKATAADDDVVWSQTNETSLSGGTF